MGLRTPRVRDRHVAQFCRRLVPGSRPVLLHPRPMLGAEPLECFEVVEQRVRRDGGEMVIGWAIWEWKRVLIEAEFHAVWRSPNGDLEDLTPQRDCRAVLFVPDPKRQYQGRKVDNIRRPLTKNPRAAEVIRLSEERLPW